VAARHYAPEFSAEMLEWLGYLRAKLAKNRGSR
jgi:hypothetical protein